MTNYVTTIYFNQGGNADGADNFIRSWTQREAACVVAGYVYEKAAGSQNCQRIVKVCHTDDQAEEELSTIVDFGEIVLDVMVNHRTYGKVTAPLNIKSRRDIRKFVEDLKQSKSSLLSNTTSGYHFHTIEAESEDILDEIEEALKEKHFLVDFLDYETTFKQ